MEFIEPSQRLRWPIALALALLTFATFHSVVDCGYINYDDASYVTGNPHVQQGLSLANVRWAFTTTDAGYWQPLTWLSLMLDVTLRGCHAAAFHWTNLVLHSLSAAVVFLVLSQMTRTTWRAALVAAIYALHPLRVESVAWIAERKDVLSNLLAWLTISAYVAHARSPGSWRYLLVLVLFGLGLMAKPMLVTLPFLLMLLDYWPLYRFGICDFDPQCAPRSLGQLIVEKIPLLLLALAAGAGTFVAQRRIGAALPLSQFGVRVRLANVAVSYVRYLWKMFDLHHLAIFYPMTAWLWWQVALAAIALTGITLITVLRARQQPWLLVGWLWYLGVMAPVAGLFQAGYQSIADRFTYLPTVGLLILFVWSIPYRMLNNVPIRKYLASGSAVVAMLVMLCVFTHQQIRYWRDSRSLFQHALAVTNNNWLAHDQIALVLQREGDLAGAIEETRIAISLNPGDPIGHYNLGNALSARGDCDGAIAEYRIALRLKPRQFEIHNNLGVELQKRGDLFAAMQEFTEAIELAPDFQPVYSNLGGTLAQAGMIDQAIQQLNIAIALRPDDQFTHQKLEMAIDLQQRSRKPIQASIAE